MFFRSKPQGPSEQQSLIDEKQSDYLTIPPIKPDQGPSETRPSIQDKSDQVTIHEESDQDQNEQVSIQYDPTTQSFSIKCIVCVLTGAYTISSVTFYSSSAIEGIELIIKFLYEGKDIGTKESYILTAAVLLYYISVYAPSVYRVFQNKYMVTLNTSPQKGIWSLLGYTPLGITTGIGKGLATFGGAFKLFRRFSWPIPVAIPLASIAGCIYAGTEGAFYSAEDRLHGSWLTWLKGCFISNQTEEKVEETNTPATPSPCNH